jgi:hypothetical protein
MGEGMAYEAGALPMGGLRATPGRAARFRPHERRIPAGSEGSLWARRVGVAESPYLDSTRSAAELVGRETPVMLPFAIVNALPAAGAAPAVIR